MTFQTITLPVRALEVCDRTRVRKIAPQAGSDIVLEYADAYRSGLILEPLDVFREKGTERYIVADGEHRLLALRRAQIEKVECRLREGDEVDALEFATRCNQRHGLRRTKADIYYAFVRIKETPRLADKYRTDGDLSDQLGVSRATIQRYQIEWRNSEGGNARVRDKKREARERAEKHTAPRETNASLRRFQVSENGEKLSEPARIATRTEALSPSDAPGSPPAEALMDDSGVPSAEEIAESEAALRADQEAMAKLLEADDKLAWAMGEVKRLTGLLRIAEQSRDEAINGKGAYVKLLKEEQRKTVRLGEKLDAANATIARKDQEIEKLREDNGQLRERIAIMEEAA